MDDRGSGLRLYVWAMGALALVAAVWVAWTWSELAQLQSVAASDRKTVQGRFAKLAAQVETLASQTLDPKLEEERREKGNFQQFLERAAMRSQIPSSAVTIFQRREERVPRGNFLEITYRVKISRASRHSIADFCYRVEYYRD